MTTPNKYAALRGEAACTMLQSLVLERAGAKADWERAEAELAREYPELTAAAKAHEEEERVNKIIRR